MTLPRGSLTFLLTDVEDSTSLWERSPEAMRRALVEHDRVIDHAVADHQGTLIRPRGEGDSRFAVFTNAADAIAAAVRMQRDLLALNGEPALRVRIGIHTGEAELRDDDYYGTAVNRCARIRSLGHGGQTLTSGVTVALADRSLPPGVSVRDLGSHRLKGLSEPQHIFQVDHPDLPSAFPSLQGLPITADNLPAPVTDFVGRRAEIAEVRELLAGARLVTLTGSAGCGKTQLAVEVARSMRQGEPDGVWFADLAPLTEPALVPFEVARALAIRDEPGRTITETIVETLSTRQTLLVLDNCEHLLDACAALVLELLSGCPNVRILATGREPIGIAGEVAWRVPSLRLPDGPVRTLADVEQVDAVALFIERARAAAPHATLDDAAAPVVAQICTRLDGIPLAIELAAACVAVLTPQQIGARLDDRFRLLTGGSRTALERQQTLRAAVDWSYALLTEDEKVLFRRLSVFAGGFSLEAAEEICSGAPIDECDVLDVLAALVRKSLVSVEHHGTAARYRMLETMRQYAREKLLEANEGTTVRRRHVVWCGSLAEQAEPKLEGAEQERWLHRLEEEHDNLRAAMEWGLSTDPAAAMRIAFAIRWFWFVRGYWREGRRWVEQFLATGDDDAVARAHAVETAGLLSLVQIEVDPGGTYYEEALRLARERGDELAIVRALSGLAEITTWRGGPAHARALCEEALVIAERLGNQRQIAHLLTQVAAVESDRGTAWSLYTRALEAAQRSGDVNTIGFVANRLGIVAMSGGDLEQAQKHFDQALGPLHAVGDERLIANTTRHLAEIALATGDTARARSLFESAASIDWDLGSKVRRAMALLALGRIAQIDADARGALSLFEEGLALARGSKTPAFIAAFLPPIADILMTLGDTDGAIDALEEAASINESLGEQARATEARARLAGIRGSYLPRSSPGWAARGRGIEWMVTQRGRSVDHGQGRVQESVPEEDSRDEEDLRTEGAGREEEHRTEGAGREEEHPGVAQARPETEGHPIAQALREARAEVGGEASAEGKARLRLLAGLQGDEGPARREGREPR